MNFVKKVAFKIYYPYSPWTEEDWPHTWESLYDEDYPIRELFSKKSIWDSWIELYIQQEELAGNSKDRMALAYKQLWNITGPS